MKLLFICTHNRCRSILAEAVANHIGGGRIQAQSAGSAPAQQVHPLSIEYLEQRGMPTAGLISQSWDDFSEFNPDAILTLCDSAAAETCPVWFGSAVQVHWGLPDPSAGEVSDSLRADRFHNTIDILCQRITALMQADKFSLRGQALGQELKDAALQYSSA